MAYNIQNQAQSFVHEKFSDLMNNYRKTSSSKVREKIILSFYPYLLATSASICVKKHMIDDLISVGFKTIEDTLETNKFKIFSYKYFISNAYHSMVEYYYKMDNPFYMPPRIIDIIILIKKYIHMYCFENKKYPTKDEIVNYIKSYKDYSRYNIRKILLIFDYKIVFLQNFVPNMPYYSFNDVIYDMDIDSVEDICFKNERSKYIEEWYKNLTSIERYIVDNRILYDEIQTSYKNIGLILHISYKSIPIILKKSLEKLKVRLDELEN